jgi:hypothetical protein
MKGAQSIDRLHYGNTGCEVLKRGIQNWKDFCLRINIPKISFGYIDSYAKIFLILYPLLENSTTRIAIAYILKTLSRHLVAICYQQKNI